MTRRRHLGLRFLVVAAAIAAVALAASPPASAHTVGGVSATDYQSRIVGLAPPMPGISVRLLDLGRRIELANNTAADLVVVGYQGEAYLRIGPTGVYENIHSPAVYQNQRLPPGVTTTLPPIAQPAAAPQWQKVSAGHTATWYDRRTRWEGPRPPAVKQDPGRVAAVADWAIPLRRGTVTIVVEGRIVWVPPPSPLPWLGLAAALFVVALGVGHTRRWGAGLSILLALLVAVDVVRSYSTALVSGGSQRIEILRTLLAGEIGFLLWAVGVWAVAQLQRERERGLLAAVAAGIGIGLFSGLTDLPYLLHSQVPVAAAPAVGRAGVAVAIGLGLGVATACVLHLRHPPLDQGVEPDAVVDENSNPS